MSKWIIGIATIAVLGFMVHIETKLDKLDVIEAKVEALNQIVQTTTVVKYSKKDVDCLAKNIYYEAGVEDEIGKFAVGHVTLNRLKTGYWGKDICAVVYSKNQFSWTRIKKLKKPGSENWNKSMIVAYQVLNGQRVNTLGQSLFYHADYIKTPNWVVPGEQITQIGRHIFYRKAKNSWLEV